MLRLGVARRSLGGFSRARLHLEVDLANLTGQIVRGDAQGIVPEPFGRVHLYGRLGFLSLDEGRLRLGVFLLLFKRGGAGYEHVGG